MTLRSNIFRNLAPYGICAQYPLNQHQSILAPEEVDSVLQKVCLDIEKRYQVKFQEIGTDKDHVHFLVQSVPMYSVTKIVTMIKSITAREIFKRCPQVKRQLWGGEFWSDGYFGSTVGKHGNEDMIARYVRKQGQQYQKLYEDHQLVLF